mmetsp:Transcript_115122/g.311114  ORF Transcript_115122/g.311114 Transcript_115122/m.311114 type:complete len:90 (+) Transcript_115122:1469-1738(+)
MKSCRKHCSPPLPLPRQTATLVLEEMEAAPMAATAPQAWPTGWSVAPRARRKALSRAGGQPQRCYVPERQKSLLSFVPEWCPPTILEVT